MAPRDTTRRIARSLTLLRVFVGVSALLLAAAALVLGIVLTNALRQQAVDSEKGGLTQFANAAFSEQILESGEMRVGTANAQVFYESLAARPDVLSVKVWRPDGVLAWTNIAQERIGKQFPLEGSHVQEVIQTGAAEAELEALGDEEDSAEAALGVDHVIEVYAPVLGPGGKIVGAFEIYADSSRVEASIAERKRLIWMATGLVFAALWALLVLLVRGASQMLRRQTETLRARSKALMDAYARLEESSLEAIESLNATVEAKDPYTAGHSRRVQLIALAVGEELRLQRERLDTLRHAALFHDIGKLAVPDAVLTKPDRLTPEEFEIIKRHSSEGARIVGKLGRLRDTVPIIEHHHERWDGRGYPAGLSAGEIPLEAAIVALADAWDAMTTDRPYHRALTLEEATAEVRSGRGTQFTPEVVDAFFAVLRRGGLQRVLDGKPEAVALVAEAG